MNEYERRLDEWNGDPRSAEGARALQSAKASERLPKPRGYALVEMREHRDYPVNITLAQSRVLNSQKG